MLDAINYKEKKYEINKKLFKKYSINKCFLITYNILYICKAKNVNLIKSSYQNRRMKIYSIYLFVFYLLMLIEADYIMF